MTAGRSKQMDRRRVARTSRSNLLVWLIQRRRLAMVIPLVLDILEEDPLSSAGQFRGDLLRGLMDVPGRFWGRHPELYERYRAALRAGASARRQLPLEERLQFWGPLEPPTSRSEERSAPRAPDGGSKPARDPEGA
jgi:hypothetical protein